MKHRPKTSALLERSLRVMPGGVNSPARSFQSIGIMPIIVERGKDDMIYDVDGHGYIDFCGSWGSLILGHVPSSIFTALTQQLSQGTSFGTMTPLEAVFAEEVIDTIGFIDKVRFVSSGTEATLSVIRLARGYTGKKIIVKFCGNYHGHHDALLVKAGSGVFTLDESTSAGIPKEVLAHTVCLTYNDYEGVSRFLDLAEDVAAVILEPVAGNMGVIPADPYFFSMLRKKTEEKGILLIVDEVITGFRLGLKGACELYDIIPDLVCYGKVIGGGFPVAAFGGKKEIMDKLAPLGGVYQAGTLSGNPMAMRAGLETLRILKDNPDFYKNLEEKTRFLTDPITAFIKRYELPLCLQRVGSMFTLFFGVSSLSSHEDLAGIDLEAFKKFYTELFEQGIYFSPSPHEACFVSAAHTYEHLSYTRNVILNYLLEHYVQGKAESEEVLLEKF